jgi:peptide/nickel transport system permease protein
MGAYLLRRLLLAVPALLGISLVSFIIIELAPGDAVSAMLGVEGVGSGATQAMLQERLGLDAPWPARYWQWLSNLARGDLGRSLIDQQPITSILANAAGLTLQLTVPALVIGLLIALVLGVWTGARPYSRLDNVVSLLSLTIAGVPAFVLGFVLLYVFAVQLNWLPPGGSQPIGIAAPPFFERLSYFVLPLATLAVLEAASLVRYVRDSVINVRSVDFVQTARAKGLSPTPVLARHVLRNALLPIITVTALQIPGLLSGALLVEVVFGWGGLGSRTALAVGQRDFPVIMGTTMLAGVIVVLSSLVADVLYALADPRIRLR